MKIEHYSVKLSMYFNDQQKLFPTGIILSDTEVDFLKKNKAGLSGRIKSDELHQLGQKVYGQDYTDPLLETKKETFLCRAQKAIAHADGKFNFERFGNF